VLQSAWIAAPQVVGAGGNRGAMAAIGAGIAYLAIWQLFEKIGNVICHRKSSLDRRTRYFRGPE